MEVMGYVEAMRLDPRYAPQKVLERHVKREQRRTMHQKAIAARGRKL